MRSNNLDILYIGYLQSEDQANLFFPLDPSPAIQTQKFGAKFLNVVYGISTKLSIISFFPIQNYPIVKKLFFKKTLFYFNNILCKSLFFINIILLKHITRLISLCMETFLVKNFHAKLVIIHGTHFPYLVIGLILKFFGGKILLILTDPQGVVLPTDGMASTFLKKIDAYFAKIIVSKFDGFIIFSRSFEKLYNLKKNIFLLPGIASTPQFSISSSVSAEADANKFIVVYAGSLAEEYGVRLLLQAMQFMRHDNIEIQFYGWGNLVEEISIHARYNSGIRYMGVVNERELVMAYSKASLLINPRPVELDTSIYSFPSKILDYMASSRPVLTTKLFSIESVFDEYLYYINGPLAHDIAAAILNIKNISPVNRNIKAKMARQFIDENFSEKAVAIKLAIFLKSL